MIGTTIEPTVIVGDYRRNLENDRQDLQGKDVWVTPFYGRPDVGSALVILSYTDEIVTEVRFYFRDTPAGDVWEKLEKANHYLAIAKHYADVYDEDENNPEWAYKLFENNKIAVEAILKDVFYPWR